MKVLKFGAVWCIECLTMRPLWKKIEEEMPDLETVYYDADEHQEILDKYEVKDIPTFIFLDKNGQELERFKGIKRREDIMELIKKNLDK